MWDRALISYEAGEQTVEDLCALIGFSRRTIFSRLAEARERRENCESEAAIAAAEGTAIPEDRRDKYGSELDSDALLLILTDDPRDEIRARRKYDNDPIHGEVAYALRPAYCTGNDLIYDEACQPSFEDTTIPVLIPNRNSVTFRRRRLGRGDPVIDAGPTKLEPDAMGRKGGTAPARPEPEKQWRIETPEQTVEVSATTKKEAKIKAKAMLSIPKGTQFPLGTRIVQAAG